MKNCRTPFRFHSLIVELKQPIRRDIAQVEIVDCSVNAGMQSKLIIDLYPLGHDNLKLGRELSYSF